MDEEKYGKFLEAKKEVGEKWGLPSLWERIVYKLDEHGKKVGEISQVQICGKKIEVERFREIAEMIYADDDEISTDLKIIGDGWWMQEIGCEECVEMTVLFQPQKSREKFDGEILEVIWPSIKTEYENYDVEKSSEEVGNLQNGIKTHTRYYKEWNLDK